jgi:eukaryotic-like serine/threonine-protein kinase
MQLICPYCSSPTSGKAPKPGRYTPKCPKCGKAFVVVVADDPDQPPTVQPLPAADLQATGAYVPVADPNATGSFELPALDPVATEEYPPVNPAATMPQSVQPQEIIPLTLAPPPEMTALHKAKQTLQPRPVAKTTAKLSRKDVVYRVPTLLGGYHVVKELGRGGMGAVFLARQLSLDRRVALKVMSPVYAADAGFVARFVREAYAAAQLTHPNIVQIYDIGTDLGWNYFSMEYVQGRSLGDILRQDGKLEPDTAVGYILQAARGLQYAHDMGMVHRDIKPDNLLVNEHGVVKVTDLGLVKIQSLEEVQSNDAPTPSGIFEAATVDVTRADITLGTPAYMAPEQARNVSGVDPRADVYSLGCTLYVLLTGRPPFEGKTVMEIITKHATIPVTLPEVMVNRVPKALSAILLKMMAKKPEERYATMDEVIRALEGYLQLQHAGPAKPRQEHADQLAAAVKAFNNVPWARARTPLLLGFAGLCAALFILFLLLRVPVGVGAVAGLGLFFSLAYFTVHGQTHHTPLFVRMRELVMGSRRSDLLIGAGALLLILLVLFIVDLLWLSLGVFFLASALAVVFHYSVDKPLARQRTESVEQAEQIFRHLRLQSMDEDHLRRFVVKYAGRQWEEFYETLFGYEAMLHAREWTRREAAPADHFGAWRDPLIRWLDAKLRARREAKEKQHLQAVEERNLQAQGMEASAARLKAELTAERLIHQAAELKLAAQTTEAEDRADRRRRVREMLELSEWEPVTLRHRNSLPQRLCDRFFNARIRFILGLILIAGWLGWMGQNGLLPTSSLEKAFKTGNVAHVATVNDDLQHTAAKSERATKPLTIPMVPEAMTGWFDSYNPGVAGLLLVISAFTYGWIMSVLVLLGAVIAFAGHKLGLPDLGPLAASHASMAAGGVVALLGLVFGRSR